MTPFILVFVAVILSVFLPAWLRARRKKRAEQVGRTMVATVLSITPTGARSGADPYLRLTLALRDSEGHEDQATLTDLFLTSAMPKVGDTLAVVVDPGRPGEAFLQTDQDLLARHDRTAEVLAAVNTVPLSMRNNPPQVGDIVAITPVGNGEDSYQVNVVHIGQPPSTVFCQQSFQEGRPYSVGDRVYLVTDGQTPPRNGFIMPLSFSHGERLARTGNRADMLVGDALLFSGAKGTCIVQGITPGTVPEAYRTRNTAKWELRVQVDPQNGSPVYDGEVTIVANTVERAAAVTQIGATLPVRYDPYDPPTFVIDTITLGWGDPALFRQQLKREHLAENS